MAIDSSALYSSATAPATNGGTLFLDQYNEFVGALIDTAVLRLANVAGTNVITATAAPFSVPATGVVGGAKFTLVPVANNTSAATLNVDGSGAKNIVNGDGSALSPDDLVAGTRYILEYGGTNYVIISGGGGGAVGSAATDKIVFSSTGVFANNFPANTLIQVELWGGGGGGRNGTGSGGGGGGYARETYLAGGLPANITVTIGAGGAIEANGGNTTFGSLLTAYGGERGFSTLGGVGGGEVESGANGGSIGGGDAASDNADAKTIYGGAGGGGNGTGGLGINAGNAVYGGGGGSLGTEPGGKSAYGGDGGDNGQPGAPRGGGGGALSVGGRGEAVITIFGG